MSDLAGAMPFASLLGVKTTEAKSERVVGTMTVRDDLCTAGENVHGGALVAFADSLGAIGAYRNLPEGAEGTTTIESKTNFLAGAKAGERLEGVATPVSLGRRLSVWETRISREGGRLVALVVQTQCLTSSQI